MLIRLEQSLSAVKLLQQLHSLGNMAVSCASCTCSAMQATGSAIPYVSTLSADSLCTADVCSSADDGSQQLLVLVIQWQGNTNFEMKGLP